MEQKYEKYLPIGSVVLLKNATKKLMITGFCIIPNENEKKEMFDYSGCLYPEGVISSEQVAVFNHDQIEKIYAIGYSDEEEKNFKIKLKEEILKQG